MVECGSWENNKEILAIREMRIDLYFRTHQVTVFLMIVIILGMGFQTFRRDGISGTSSCGQELDRTAGLPEDYDDDTQRITWL